MEDFIEQMNMWTPIVDRVRIIEQMTKHLENNYDIRKRVLRYQDILIQIIKQCLLRDINMEVKAVADLIPLVYIYIGKKSELRAQVDPILVSVYQDQGRHEDVRVKCCSSMALLVFWSDEDDTKDVLEHVRIIYEQINCCFRIDVQRSKLFFVSIHYLKLLLMLVPNKNIYMFNNQNEFRLPPIKRYRKRLYLADEHLKIKIFTYKISYLNEIDPENTLSEGQVMTFQPLARPGRNIIPTEHLSQYIEFESGEIISILYLKTSSENEHYRMTYNTSEIRWSAFTEIFKNSCYLRKTHHINYCHLSKRELLKTKYVISNCF